MDNFQTFDKNDFKNVIPLELLENYLFVLIKWLRNNTNDNSIISLKKEIKELEALGEILQQKSFTSNEKTVNEIYSIYKKIQKISLELKKMLPKKLNLSTYDKINYAIYMDETRYYVNELNADFLQVSSTGNLMIKLNKVVDDVKKNGQTIQKEMIQNIFTEHYSLYFNAIKGMYYKQNKKQLGVRGAKLNRGHVAEAFEHHLSEHHSRFYYFSKKINYSEEELFSTIKQHYNEFTISYWSNKESPTSAWKHIRTARGRLRGTVAGDVKDTQVKSGYKKSGTRLKLASLKSLKDGVDNYSRIFKENLSDSEIKILAHEIARYLSEAVRVPTEEVAAKIANKYIGKELSNLSKTYFVRLS